MKIAIILPYFGKFDKLFPLWLKSCEKNTTIDWLIYTDDNRNFTYPDNVKVHYTTFAELRRRIQSLYDFRIALDSPYGLCDYKPAYGEIFRKEIMEGSYDAWGFCDNDLIFGNVSKFIKNINLDSKFQFNTFGHLSILPATEEAMTAYRYADAYKIAFTTRENLFFDEVAFIKILKTLQFKSMHTAVANFVPRLKNFYIDFEKGREWINRRHVFVWDKGDLFRYYIDRSNKIVRDEYCYIHFLKRPMQLANNLDFSKPIAIVPNKMFNIALNDIDENFIINHNSPGIFWNYWKNSFKPKNLFKRIYYRLYRNKINFQLMKKIDDIISSSIKTI